MILRNLAAISMSTVCVLLLSTSSAASSEEVDPRSAFFARLSTLCGSVFEGYSSFPTDPEDSFAGKLLVASVETCSSDELRIPFVVGENRSRTWIIRHDAPALQLKHDHRHEDGSPDEVTMYGGWADEGGSGFSQSFAADPYTQELIPEATTNVWTLSLSEDGQELTYYLERHSEPRFKATLRLQ